jgi:hypothetical protein
MLDFATGLAPHMYDALRAEREAEAEKRRWNRRLRELKAADRAAEARTETIIVNAPAHLAGVHKL